MHFLWARPPLRLLALLLSQSLTITHSVCMPSRPVDSPARFVAQIPAPCLPPAGPWPGPNLGFVLCKMGLLTAPACCCHPRAKRGCPSGPAQGEGARILLSFCAYSCSVRVEEETQGFPVDRSLSYERRNPAPISQSGQVQLVSFRLRKAAIAPFPPLHKAGDAGAHRRQVTPSQDTVTVPYRTRSEALTAWEGG